jgi:hypothetical protein
MTFKQFTVLEFKRSSWASVKSDEMRILTEACQWAKAGYYFKLTFNHVCMGNE